MSLLKMTAAELAAAIKEGRTTAVEAVQETLAQIEEKERLYHAYVTVDKEKALAQAAAVQEKIEKGE